MSPFCHLLLQKVGFLCWMKVPPSPRQDSNIESGQDLEWENLPPPNKHVVIPLPHSHCITMQLTFHFQSWGNEGPQKGSDLASSLWWAEPCVPVPFLEPNLPVCFPGCFSLAQGSLFSVSLYTVVCTKGRILVYAGWQRQG